MAMIIAVSVTFRLQNLWGSDSMIRFDLPKPSGSRAADEVGHVHYIERSLDTPDCGSYHSANNPKTLQQGFPESGMSRRQP